MKAMFLVLFVLCVTVQYKLWLGSGGIHAVLALQHDIDVQTTENKQTTALNNKLAIEVNDLKNGFDAIEERARMELGMVSSNELFIQIIDYTSAE